MRRFIFLSLTLILAAAFCVPGGAARPAASRVRGSVSGSAIPKLPAVMTTYDIYVGGIHFLTADILFQEQAGRYKTHLHARTAGYLYKILKWDGDISSQGRIAGDRFEPAMYRNLDVWKNKPKETELDFDNKGGIKTEFNPPSNDKGREPVTDAQKKGALDPVTALLQMLGHVAADGSCALSVPVFDGKRRFDLLGEDKGYQSVDEGDYGVYSGPARLCSVDFDMIAGDWTDRKKNRFWERENGEKGRDAFHIWLASVAPEMPELPVRLESTSPFGDIVAHLTGWHYATKDEIGR